MSTLIMEDEKNMILYINSLALLPSKSDSYYNYKEIFDLTIMERAYIFAAEEDWQTILNAIGNHPDWSLSEFCEPY